MEQKVGMVHFHYTELLFPVSPATNMSTGVLPSVTTCLTSSARCVTSRGQLRTVASDLHRWYSFDVSALFIKDKIPAQGLTPALTGITVRYDISNGFYEDLFDLAQTPFLTFYPNKRVLAGLKKRKNVKVRRPRRASRAQGNALKTEDCRVYPWVVTLDDLGWKGLVLQPEILDIGFCHGDCKFNSATVNATYISRNAYVRGVFLDVTKRHGRGSRRRSGVPPPACVPNKLQPLSLIFMDGPLVTYKHVAEMIAITCRCL